MVLTDNAMISHTAVQFQGHLVLICGQSLDDRNSINVKARHASEFSSNEML